MSDNIYWKDALKEKVYSGNINESIEKTDSELNDFFNELVKRKRNDLYEGGLQANLIAFPASFAAKISEDDGTEPHMANQYNLYSYLTRNNKYLTKEGRSHYNLFMKEYMFIENMGFSIRILNSADTLLLAIVSNNVIESDYQIHLLINIINKCKDMLDNDIYKNIELGIHSKNIQIEFNENSLDEILEIVSKINNKSK